jgi:hypothetical protein
VTQALQFKLRNTVKGYIQEQGIDYDQSFAGVAGDTVIRLTLAISLYEEQKNDDWAVEAIDVEAAFLEGQMDHELYIDQPYMYQEYCVKPGIKLGENDVIRLKISQYECPKCADLVEEVCLHRDQQRVPASCNNARRIPASSIVETRTERLCY